MLFWPHWRIFVQKGPSSLKNAKYGFISKLVRIYLETLTDVCVVTPLAIWSSFESFHSKALVRTMSASLLVVVRTFFQRAPSLVFRIHSTVRAIISYTRLARRVIYRPDHWNPGVWAPSAIVLFGVYSQRSTEPVGVFVSAERCFRLCRHSLLTFCEIPAEIVLSRPWSTTTRCDHPAAFRKCRGVSSINGKSC